jgi:hypothetical protein
MIKIRVKKIKEKILKDLKFIIKVFLAINVWTNLNHLAFLNIIVYFIDRSWKYKKILIAFYSLSDQHIEEKMIDVMIEILKRYNLTNRFMSLTTNNVSNNKTLHKYVSKLLLTINVHWCKKSDIVNYMTHMLQLTMTTFLIKLKVQITNDDVAMKFDEKKLKKISISTILKNDLRKMIFNFLLIFIIKNYYFEFDFSQWQ